MNTHEFRFIKNVSSLLHEHFGVFEEVSDFIGCQFALESSYGKSSLAKTHKNFCGMKTPLVRVSVALNYRNSVDQWARYDDLLHCVYDFMFCLAYRHPMSVVFESVNEYKNFIKGWYCPEKSYIDRINSIYVQFQNHLKNGN